MSDYSSEYANHVSGGNLALSIFVVVVVMGMLSMLGSHDDNSTHSTPVLSGNEVLSRNQANFFSDVRNEFYDCLAPGSCVMSINTESSSSSSTTVTGDRNTLAFPDRAVFADGIERCFDGQNYTAEKCREGQP